MPGSVVTSDAASRAGAILEIDLGAIVANWRTLAGLTAPAQCAAVVKADAYGLGAGPVVQALADAGCELFFVATLDEGIVLRQHLGAHPEVAILNGPHPGTAGEFVAYQLSPVLNEPGQIAEWAGLATSRRGKAPPAILQVDTGMARLGLTASEFAALADAPPLIPWRAVMSHLACSDSPGHALNRHQLECFTVLAKRFPGIPRSLAASFGIFLGREFHFDLVRPGAALYGVDPCPGHAHALRSVVRLSAKILQVRQIDTHQPVGYGAAHVMAGPGRVATVAVGYADGWLRSFSQRGCGFIAGKRVPLIGRVSMDLAAFDVSAVAEAVAYPGAVIELLGSAYGVDDAAADAGTIGYELLTALGSRYHRVYRQAAEDAGA